MKKVFAVFLAAVLCLAFCACGGDGDPTMEIEITQDMEQDDVAVAALKEFKNSSLYEKLVDGYEKNSGNEGNGFTITRATEYSIPELEGKAYHLLMINADAMVYSEPDGCYFDRVILMVDLDNGNVYDNYYCLNTASYMGQMETEEDILTYCMAVYNSYLLDCNEGIMTSAESDETHRDLTADEIAEINAAIQ